MVKTLEQFVLDCLHLSDPWRVDEVESPTEGGNPYTQVYLSVPRGSLVPCPKCGRMCICHDHTRERVWRGSDVMNAYTFIHARVPRTDCPECGVLTAEVPWARPGARFTLCFETMMLALAMEMPMTTVARMVHVDPKTVQGVVRRY